MRNINVATSPKPTTQRFQGCCCFSKNLIHQISVVVVCFWEGSLIKDFRPICFLFVLSRLFSTVDPYRRPKCSSSKTGSRLQRACSVVTVESQPSLPRESGRCRSSCPLRRCRRRGSPSCVCDFRPTDPFTCRRAPFVLHWCSFCCIVAHRSRRYCGNPNPPRVISIFAVICMWLRWKDSRAILLSSSCR